MKYEQISFVPPQAVANTAAKGLEYRAKAGGRGGLDVEQAAKGGVGSGVQRAVNLKNRDRLSPETVKRMKAFFDRHEKNKKIDPKFKDEPWRDRGYVAWLLWGGDPGYEWARKTVERMERLDKTRKEKKAFVSGLAEHMRILAAEMDRADIVGKVDGVVEDLMSQVHIPDQSKREFLQSLEDLGIRVKEADLAEEMKKYLKGYLGTKIRN